MLFSGAARTNLLFQMFQPITAANATNDALNAAIAGFRRTHFWVYVKNPLRFAWIGSCFSQCSKSSASARADKYRWFGSFSKHFKQIAERSRFTLGFSVRGERGSVS